jgi:hypothetical protein
MPSHARSEKDFSAYAYDIDALLKEEAEQTEAPYSLMRLASRNRLFKQSYYES